MKLFADTADVKEIKDLLDRGVIDGVTTNPSIIAKAAKDASVPLNKAFVENQIGKIIDAINASDPTEDFHLSVEVWSRDPDEILRQAHHLRDTFNYLDLSIKVQIGWDELRVIRKLKEERFSVNCTCCMTPTQALLAAKAGADYVSLFVGRIRDFSCISETADQAVRLLGVARKSGDKDLTKDAEEVLKKKQKIMQTQVNYHLERGIVGVEEIGEGAPFNVIGMTRALLEEMGSKTQIIAGSIRSADDAKKSGLTGAHIATVQPKFFREMLEHWKTEEVITQFLGDFKPLLQE